MENHEIKKIIEVDGVILTGEGIKQLKTLQEHNNEMIIEAQAIIADAICLIVKHYDDMYESEKSKVTVLMAELAMVRDNFNDLKKP